MVITSLKIMTMLQTSTQEMNGTSMSWSGLQTISHGPLMDTKFVMFQEMIHLCNS